MQVFGAPAATNSQSVGNVTLGPGASAIQAITGFGGTLNVAMGSITRNTGGMINFTLPGNAAAVGTAVLLTDSNSVAFATVNSTDWAAAAPGNVIVAGSAVSGFYTPSTYGALSGNADVASGIDTTLSANTLVNSLRFNQNQWRTINIGGNTLATGGILVTPNVATPGSNITGGTLQAPVGGDLVVIQNSGQDFTISATIADNTISTPLDKYGAGNLVFGGANTYTGNTSIWGGTITLTNSNGLAGSTLNYNNQGGSLSFGGLTSALLGGLSGSQSLALLNASSAAVALSVGGNGQNTTYSGVLSDGGNGGSLTLVGSGILTLAGASTFTGNTSLAGGTLTLANVNALGTSTLNYNSQGGLLNFGTLTSALLGGLTGSQTLALQNASSAAVVLSVGGNNQSTVYSGVFSGSGSLTKIGSGTFSLAAANTYTGNTVISGGVLTLANSNALAGSTLNYNNQGGSLSFGGLTSAALGGLSGAQNLALQNASSAPVVLTVGGNNQSNTYSGILSGSGGLTVTGNGIFTLAGANTFSGSTTISGGTLNFTALDNLGATASTIAFQNGGTLLYSNSASVSFGSDHPLKFVGNGTINVSSSAAYLEVYPTYSGTGTLTKTGLGQLGFESSGSGPTGPMVIAQGSFMQTSEHTANVTALTVQNGGQYEIFDDQNNDASPGGANFSMASAATITLNGMGPVPPVGTVGTLGALLYTPQSTGNQGIALVTNNIVLQTNSSIVVNNSSTNVFKLRLNGNITGSGSLIKDYLSAMPSGRSGESSYSVNSMGILALGGTNTYTGNTTINSGTILLQSFSALPATTTVSIDSQNGSTLDLGGCNATIAGLLNGPNGGGTITNCGTNQIALPGNATLTVTGSVNFSGVIQDGLYKTGLAMTGSGLQTLAGANTYSGGTYFSGGTLQLGSNSALGTGALTANAGIVDLAGNSPAFGSLGGATGTITNSVATPVTLNVNQLAATTFAGTLQDGSGTTALVMTGTGTLSMAGSNTYSGGTTLSGGKLNLGVAENAGVCGPLGTATAAGSIVLNGGFLQYSAVNQYDYSPRFSTAANQAYDVDTNGQNVTWATALTSSGGSLTKIGAGILTLTASNTYSGATTVSAGTLQLDFTQSNSPAANILPAGTNLLLSASSALQVLGAPSTANSQTVGNVTINPGSSAIQAISSSGTLNVTLGSITRSPGGVIDFTVPAYGGVSTTSGTASTLLSDANGVAYATVAGADWAAMDVNNQYVVPGSTIPGFYTLTTTGTMGGNADVASGIDTTLSSNAFVGSLRFNQNEGRTINIGGNTLTTGGILVTANVATAGSTITGGTLRGPAGGDLVVIQNSGQDFTISATIADNTVSTPLNKYGAGNLVLGGSNTYTGNTNIWKGTLTLANTGALAGSTLNYNTLGGSLSFGTLTSAALGGLTGSQPLALLNASSAAVALSVGGNNQNTTYSGVLSDSGSGGSLTKIGSGTLTLTAVNTYTGYTSIAAGTLALANPNALAGSTLYYNGQGGSVSFGTLTSVSLGGLVGGQSLALQNASAQPLALTVGGNNQSNIYGGALSGSGALTVIGSGQFTLVGNNTFTGGLTVNAGAMVTLTGSNSYTGGTTISGGTVNFMSLLANLGASGVPVTFQNNGTLLYSGSANLSPTNTRPLRFTGNGTIAVSNPAVNLYFTSDYVTGTGTMTKSGAGELQFGSTGNGQSGPIVVAQGSFMETSNRIPNVTGMLVQSGGQWEIMDNVNNDTDPGGANFSIGSGAIITLSGLGPVGSGGAILYTPQSNAQGIALVTNNIVLQTDSSVVVVDAASYTYKLRLNGNISGSGGLIKDYLGGVPLGRAGESSYFTDSMGIMALGGTNTYTGNTTINSGTILLQSPAALPATTTVYIDSQNGSTLDLGGCNATIAGLENGPNGGGTIANSGTNQIVSPSNATLTVAGSGYFSGVIKDGLYQTALVKTGTSMLTLAGSNTYSGATSINSGTLQIGNGTSGEYLASPSISNNGSLVFNHSDALVYSGAISGNGGLTKLGTGSLTLSGSSTYSGGTTLSNGTLGVTSDAGLGVTSGNLSIGAATLEVAGGFPSSRNITLANANAAIQVDPTYTYSNVGTISGPGGLNKTGAGTLELAGAGTLGRSANVNAGTLQIDGSLAVPVLNVNNAAQLAGSGTISTATSDGLLYASAAASTFGGTLSGVGPLEIDSGSLTLSGSNNYSGGTSLVGGTLVVANGVTGSALGSATLTLYGGTLAAGAAGGSIAGPVQAGSARIRSPPAPACPPVSLAS